MNTVWNRRTFLQMVGALSAGAGARWSAAQDAPPPTAPARARRANPNVTSMRKNVVGTQVKAYAWQDGTHKVRVVNVARDGQHVLGAPVFRHDTEKDVAALPYMDEVRRDGPRHHEMAWQGLAGTLESAHDLECDDAPKAVAPEYIGPVNERENFGHGTCH